jgi:hypothetical protein
VGLNSLGSGFRPCQAMWWHHQILTLGSRYGREDGKNSGGVRSQTRLKRGPGCGGRGQRYGGKVGGGTMFDWVFWKSGDPQETLTYPVACSGRPVASWEPGQSTWTKLRLLSLVMGWEKTSPWQKMVLGSKWLSRTDRAQRQSWNISLMPRRTPRKMNPPSSQEVAANKWTRA